MPCMTHKHPHHARALSRSRRTGPDLLATHWRLVAPCRCGRFATRHPCWSCAYAAASGRDTFVRTRVRSAGRRHGNGCRPAVQRTLRSRCSVVETDADRGSQHDHRVRRPGHRRGRGIAVVAGPHRDRVAQTIPEAVDKPSSERDRPKAPLQSRLAGERLAGRIHVRGTIPETPATLGVGPWTHGGWSAHDGHRLGHVDFGSDTSAFYIERVVVPFFEHHLKGAPDPELPPALVFETGTNTWRRHAADPLLPVQRPAQLRATRRGRRERQLRERSGEAGPVRRLRRPRDA